MISSACLPRRGCHRGCGARRALSDNQGASRRAWDGLKTVPYKYRKGPRDQKAFVGHGLQPCPGGAVIERPRAARVYRGDWLVRLSALSRDAASPLQWRVPPNVWGLGITSMLTDVSSEMVVSILPAYLVMTGGLAPLALGIATGLHEGGPLFAAWAGGLIADRSGRRKLTAGIGYGLSAGCRLGWFLLSGRTISAVAALVLSDRIGKAIRTAPRD